AGGRGGACVRRPASAGGRPASPSAWPAGGGGGPAVSAGRKGRRGAGRVWGIPTPAGGWRRPPPGPAAGRARRGRPPPLPTRCRRRRGSAGLSGPKAAPPPAPPAAPAPAGPAPTPPRSGRPSAGSWRDLLFFLILPAVDRG